MAIIGMEEGQPEELCGKNYCKTKHEGRDAVMQKVVVQHREPDAECEKIEGDDVKVSVTIRLKGGLIRATAVIPNEIQNQMPAIIASLGKTIDLSVRNSVNESKAFKEGWDAAMKAKAEKKQEEEAK